MILVVGGTGRLGTTLVRGRVGRPEPVRVLTRDPARAAHLGGDVDVAIGDVRDPATLADALDGVRVVVAAAHGFAGPGGVSPAAVDRDGNHHLVAAAAERAADVVLLSVVGAASDHPMELFRMKAVAECDALNSAAPTTVVRATAFAELWIDLLRQTARRSHRPLVFGRGRNPINFVSVDDVAALVDRVADDSTTRNETLEIAGPDNLTFDELAAAIRTADAMMRAPRHVPPAMLRIAAETIGRVKPEVGRQTRAAIEMDRIDLTSDAGSARVRFPDLPCTSVAQVLSVRRDVRA